MLGGHQVEEYQSVGYGNIFMTLSRLIAVGWGCGIPASIIYYNTDT